MKAKHTSIQKSYVFADPMYIFSENDSIHLDKTQMLKRFPSDKMNGTKNALFFLSRTPTHHSSTFNLRFLFGLKHKVRLSKTVCGIFHFQFRFIFIKVLIFIQQNDVIIETS